jgi:hypothetical protein
MWKYLMRMLIVLGMQTKFSMHEKQSVVSVITRISMRDQRLMVLVFQSAAVTAISAMLLEMVYI